MAERDIARGRRIKDFRKLASLSQEDLARAAGVSSKAPYLWEAGHGIKPANLRSIADALGRSPEEILGRAETPNPFRVVDEIDERLNEFRHYFAVVQERMDRQDAERHKQVALVTDALERIEGLIASLSTEEGARAFVRALGAAVPPGGTAQPGRPETGNATASLPAAEGR